MGAKDAETRARRGGTADRLGPRGMGISGGRQAARWTSEACTSGSAILRRSSWTEPMELTAGQALFRVVAVLFEVFLDQGLEQSRAVGGQNLLRNQDLSQRFVLGQNPGIHRRNEGVPADEIHLHGQNAEKQIAIVAGWAISPSIILVYAARRGFVPGAINNRALESPIYEKAEFALKPSILGHGQRVSRGKGCAANDRMGAEGQIQDIIARRTVPDGEVSRLDGRGGVEAARVVRFQDRGKAGKRPRGIAIQVSPDQGVGKNLRLVVDIPSGHQASSGHVGEDGIAAGGNVDLQVGLGEPLIAGLDEQSDEGKQVRRAVGDLYQRRAVGKANIDIRRRWNRDSQAHAQGPGFLLQDNCLEDHFHIAELPGRAETRAVGNNVAGLHDTHGKPHFHRHATLEEGLLETWDEAIDVRRRCHGRVVEVAVVAEHTVHGNRILVVRNPFASDEPAAGTGDVDVDVRRDYRILVLVELGNIECITRLSRKGGNLNRSLVRNGLAGRGRRAAHGNAR